MADQGPRSPNQLWIDPSFSGTLKPVTTRSIKKRLSGGTYVLNFEHPDSHQVTSHQATSHQVTNIDEFTVARIHRLWERWLQDTAPEQRSKHLFHRTVISAAPGLEGIRLATVYVLLARHDARLPETKLSPV